MKAAILTAISAELDEPIRLALSDALDAANAAVAIVDSARGQSLGIELKTSRNDMVTAFDTASERAIREILTDHRPGDLITGEEGGTSGNPGEEALEWFVDPIDGTANFVRDIAYHSISIAARRVADGGWLLGVVAAPALDAVWVGVAGVGAWKFSPAAPAGVRLGGVPADRPGLIVGTGFHYDTANRAAQVRRLAAVMEHFDDVRRLGSAAIDLCLVAEGALDVFYERHLGTHDWAAGAVIAEAAGARVFRPSERDLPAAGGRPDVLDEDLLAQF